MCLYLTRAHNGREIFPRLSVHALPCVLDQLGVALHVGAYAFGVLLGSAADHVDAEREQALYDIRRRQHLGDFAVQLRGEALGKQVDGAEVGLMHALGGVMACQSVTILATST